ncbi:MAG TPA: type II secretion system protein [Candidatus Dormibacteraeota bacterium]|nr:type II secretion system protein [Candidatus Dormibacteraeota bacterium]
MNRLQFKLRQFQQRAGSPSPGRSLGGFTVLELMIVMTIMLILIGVAVGNYQRTIKIARESRLKHDLQVMRVAIDNYTLDKQTAPQSLQDLVDAHYLRTLPVDPITGAADWVPHQGDTVLSPDQTGTGLDDVHSNSEQVSTEGTPYNTW